MKLTTDDNVDEFLMSDINKVYITFTNKEEVILKSITDWDINLDPINYSTISFTNAFQNKELIQHFDKKEIVEFIHIEGRGIKADDHNYIDLFYDIPCHMKIQRVCVDGGYSNCGKTFVEFEGVVG